MGVPTGSVKVGNSFIIPVRDADPFQVAFHHQPSPPLLKTRKQFGISRMPPEPSRQHRRQIGMKREYVLATVLGASRFYGKRRRWAFQIKAKWLEAGDLTSP
nr:hypothetical protein [Adhaeretor mobilis]